MGLRLWRAKARQGNAQAARELREWLRDYEVKPDVELEMTSLEDMTPEQRAFALACGREADRQGQQAAAGTEAGSGSGAAGRAVGVRHGHPPHQERDFGWGSLCSERDGEPEIHWTQGRGDER